MSFSKNLKALMKSKKITAKALAEGIGVSRGHVTHWSNGVRKPNPEQINSIISFLKIDSSLLFSNNDTKPVAKIPVVGTASCGGPEMNFSQEEGAFCYYNGEFFSPELYCVIANGDSMAPDIEDGDEIICDPNVEAEHGDMVHYQLHNESAIKVLVKNEEAGIISLKPYNGSDEFKTRIIRIDDEEMNYLKMNKVVAVNKLKFNNRAARLRLVGE